MGALALKLWCWEGYDANSLVAPFESQTGARILPQTLVCDADAAFALARNDAPAIDVLNINNAYVREYLYPRGLIATLDGDRFSPSNVEAQRFQRQHAWARGRDGEQIGICQRFGTFNLVVNTKRISIDSAEEQGFKLASDRRNRQRFGILLYEDFNIFHIAIAADLNPFVPLDESSEQRFEAMARQWFADAKIVSSDHHVLNTALVAGEIDCYLSGGVFTAGVARLAGHHEVYAVTPRYGPIDGYGAIAFTEITSVASASRQPALAEQFLSYLLQPANALQVAFLDGTCNPVTQMADERIRSACHPNQLNAIQWDTLDEDIARCVDYQLVPNHASLRVRLDRARNMAVRRMTS